MLVKRGFGDFTGVYRPKSFGEVVGQKHIVESLRSVITSANKPHCFLFQGESGCGKTTMARIMALALNCLEPKNNGEPCLQCSQCVSIMDNTNPDIQEIDAAVYTGINDVRDFRKTLTSYPMFAKNKVIIFDEAHRMSKAAHNALLKDTEELSDSTYIFFCSTEPSGILKTLRNRCDEYRFEELSDAEIEEIVNTISTFEGFSPPEKLVKGIIDVSRGKPRTAMKRLQQAINMGVENIDDILKLFDIPEDGTSEVVDLCRLLSYNKSSDIGEVMAKYRAIKASPETICVSLASWFRAGLERAKKPNFHFAKCLEMFSEPLPEVMPQNKLVLLIYKAATKNYG